MSRRLSNAGWGRMLLFPLLKVLKFLQGEGYFRFKSIEEPALINHRHQGWDNEGRDFEVVEQIPSNVHLHRVQRIDVFEKLWPRTRAGARRQTRQCQLYL